MDSFKQQWLTWIVILSAAAVCVSCQQQGITSTLREGNRTCPGEEVTFTCTLRDSLALAWRSPGYIADGNPLQFSAGSILGVDEPSRIDGRITAIATLTNNILDNGVRVLESTLRITATVVSTVTCSGESGDPISIEFSISAIPGVPQRIDTAEISRPSDNICIILVAWDPPANSDPSDIAQYIVYVPSRDIRNDISSSTLTTLTVPNCGDDVRIQVAAVNRIGCVGMNSSEVRLTRLDIPTVSTDDRLATPEGGSATTEGGSTSTSSQLGVGAVIGITIAVTIFTLCFPGLLFVCTCIYMYCVFVAGYKSTESETQEIILHELSKIHQKNFRDYLMEFYTAVKKELTEEDMLSSVDNLYKNMMDTRTSLKRLYIKEAVKSVLKTIKLDYGEHVKKVFVYLKINVPKVLSSFDDKLNDKDTNVTMDSLIRAAEQNLHESVFDELIEIMKSTEPEIVEGLLRTMFEELQTHLQPKASSVEMKWVTNLPGRTSYPNSKDDIPMEPFSRHKPGGEVHIMEFST